MPSLVVAGVSPPDCHNEPNFMHEHRFKLDDSCAMCHGKIEFGREGGGFCSNPACHGRAWPGVNLNVEVKTAGLRRRRPRKPAAKAPAGEGCRQGGQVSSAARLSMNGRAAAVSFRAVAGDTLDSLRHEGRR